MTAPLVTDLHGTSLIGASDAPGEGKSFRAVDPSTGEHLDPVFHEATPADVDRAAALAAAAFDGYRHTTAAARAAFLESIAAELDGLGNVLVERVTAETGIPGPRAAGELTRTTNQLRLFAAVVREGSWLHALLDTADPQRAPLPKPDLRQRSVPLGPVAVFAASNFPLAFSVAGGDTASALAAGAPVIVKAHPAHPGTSELVGRAIRRAVVAHGLPEGTFSMLISAGAEIGIALVDDPRIAAVGFTGSRRAGLALMAAAAARPMPIPVFAEMSSVNPVFVLPGALAARAGQLGRDFVASLNIGVGQLCTSPGLVFVADGPAAGEFVGAVTDAVAQSPAAPMLHAGIAAEFERGAGRIAATPGVAQAAIGRTDPTLACGAQTQVFVTSAAEFAAHPQLSAEVFGPCSVIVRVPSGEFDSVVKGLEGQLTATVHADPDDHVLAKALLDRLELVAGRVIVNGWPTGVEVGHATVHGGPFPATSAPATTSVGSRAIGRFLRPVAYQNVPEELLPGEISRANPDHVPQRVDGALPTR